MREQALLVIWGDSPESCIERAREVQEQMMQPFIDAMDELPEEQAEPQAKKEPIISVSEVSSENLADGDTAASAERRVHDRTTSKACPDTSNSDSCYSVPHHRSSWYRLESHSRRAHGGQKLHPSGFHFRCPATNLACLGELPIDKRLACTADSLSTYSSSCNQLQAASCKCLALLAK